MVRRALRNCMKMWNCTLALSGGGNYDKLKCFNNFDIIISNTNSQTVKHTPSKTCCKNIVLSSGLWLLHGSSWLSFSQFGSALVEQVQRFKLPRCVSQAWYGLRLINNNYVANGTGKVLASVRDEVRILSSFESRGNRGGPKHIGLLFRLYTILVSCLASRGCDYHLWSHLPRWQAGVWVLQPSKTYPTTNL